MKNIKLLYFEEFVWDYLRFDVAAEREEGLYDDLLVAGHAPVHRLNLHLRVRLNLGRDVVLAAHVLRLVVLEGLLPFCLVALNFSLGLDITDYGEFHFKLFCFPSSLACFNLLFFLFLASLT